MTGKNRLSPGIPTSQHDQMTRYDGGMNVAFCLQMLGKPGAEVRETTARMLALVKLEELANRKTAKLSGGQQERVARALAPQPRVLLLDEPLSPLDLKLRKEIQIELKRLQTETGITATDTDYDSNEAASAKIEAGGHGFDPVVPSGNHVKIFPDKGLAVPLDLARLPSHANIAPEWRDVVWDPGRTNSIPWQWGTVGVAVDTAIYSGEINTSAVRLEVPDESKGRISLVPEMPETVTLATLNYGGEPFSEDLEVLKKVRDGLLAAKPNWIAMDLGATEKTSNKDRAASASWNGSTMRIRQNLPTVAYGYPRKSYTLWLDGRNATEGRGEPGRGLCLHGLHPEARERGADLELCPLCKRCCGIRGLHGRRNGHCARGCDPGRAQGQRRHLAGLRRKGAGMHDRNLGRTAKMIGLEQSAGAKQPRHRPLAEPARSPRPKCALPYPRVVPKRARHAGMVSNQA
ncbi:MAG: hypothetical protein C0524_05265 [Rhodobacter sp.]|nr:hypothetical protein [Rhodobacter sp.]